MDTIVQFTVLGDPIPKARPGYMKSRGKFYTMRSTNDHQELIGWTLKSVYRKDPMDSCLFRVEAQFHCKNRQRRDVDNLAKALLDACTGILWKDDVQVTELEVKRIEDADNPRTEVSIFKIDGHTHRLIACERCGKKMRTFKCLHKKYCSKKCSSMKREIACDRCGKIMIRTPSMIFRRNYCSIACKKIRLEIACNTCGKKVLKYPSQIFKKTYCSRACRGMGMKGINNPRITFLRQRKPREAVLHRPA